MSSPPVRAAHSMARVRRPGASTPPSGNWWAGVSSTASASPSPSRTAPLRVHRQRAGPQPVRGGDAVRVRQAVRLQGQGRGAPAAQGPADQAETLGEPGADHDPVRAHAHAARPGQVPGQGLMQFRPAAGVRASPNASAGALFSARRAAASQRERGKAATSGDPGRRS